MKTKILLFVLSICIFSKSNAQDCKDSFYAFKQGSVHKIQHLNGKNDLQSTVIQTCKEIKSSGSNTTAVILSETFDKKDKKQGEVTLQITCEAGVVRFDMKSFAMQNMPSDMGKSGDMKMEITGDQIDMPSSLEVGSTLKNITYGMKMSMGNMNLMNKEFTIRERKVEKKEQITVPAGTFDCYKISYLADFEGMFGKKNTMKTYTWYAKGVGMVKTESYDSKDKLTNVSVLAEVK